MFKAEARSSGRFRDERGNAMLVMVMTTSISALLTVAALSVGSGALSQGEAGKRSEGARALADAAAARALSNLTTDPAYSTHPPAPEDVDRDWILDAAADAPLEVTGEGEFAWVVPEGDDATVYGIGYIPGRDDVRETEVVRVRYERVRPSGFGAMATAGSLSVADSARVTGVGGSVMSNGDLNVSGSASISGDAKAAGNYSKGSSSFVGGVGGGGYPSLLLPETDPRTYRSLTTHDLCPDATARLTAQAPCTGTIVGSGLATGWLGWEFTGSEWRVNGTPPAAASVYVYRSSVTIAGNPGSESAPWLVTIVTESLLVGSSKVNGDVSILGNPSMRPYTSGVAIVSDRDIATTSSASLEGLMLAGEQASLGGSGTLRGQVIASGISNTAGSPVTANTIMSSFVLEPESAAPTITGGVEPTDWRQM